MYLSFNLKFGRLELKAFRYSENVSPLKFNPQLKEIGCGALYLTSDLSSGVTGNVHHIDGGLHSVAIPKQENLE